ncbi:MAG: SH3 domain-containing protein [Pseudodesulfovibrio sp.]|uniref:NLP/P60 protein n=1 Tax=Pseudodesulfovibrio aespoeensis (strain ATCC 700646 / DSM 10631 / Aspo-2) TaxID=643562 RepID=E6VVP0_PSEA9|nr:MULTISPECIES: NlpC/P60 family N-terminal domain-containing protein [Pseudodesulfovibrio]MBU4192279.1 SH3 domain-containing protein [Pseudomonadota bacterium]ADU61242.1 NLP/P60 protein [Pseudodesulfovibrio aespoeensis Aspo-2]MBU4245104.1 SH3 domain-containing protein [Pseudomonadota bacterium]MBU4474298.1 SH3 domain-containing protein [Pseudomonadota bacterium]MBU4516968.1 SH3 domain-containing protein [Pseudomonadota bacterium]
MIKIPFSGVSCLHPVRSVWRGACLPARSLACGLTILLTLLLALGACSPRLKDGPVADLLTLHQDAGAYHGLDPDTLLVSQEAQAASYTSFLDAHFAPWGRTKALITADEAYWGFAAYGNARIYGENTLPRAPEWLENMREYARQDQYPSMSRRAIAVTNANMRVLPTSPPSFHDPSRAGEGFPFDIMQNSLLLAGTPLLATHTSADRAWVLVESRFTFGWVRATDIAWVDDGFEKFFRTGSYGTITRDDVPVLDCDGNYRFTTHIGAILPMLEGGFGNNGIAFVIPVRGQRGEAVAQVAFLPESVAQNAPVPATPANFTRLINAMLGRPYGWGGLYEGRDCSQAVMDLMAAFGIMLPRNSSPQAKVGEVVTLAGLDRQSKKQVIMDRATPFLTLVGKPGHIMLYLGQLDGEPVVFHAVWGLKTMTGDKPGRKIIGGAVITTLEPGLELPTLARPEGIILETVTSINTLCAPASTDGK